MPHIRPATLADLPAILPLNAVVQSWHADHFPERFRADPDPMALETYFSDMIAGDKTYLDVALQAEAVCAYMLTRLDIHDGSPFTLPRRHLQIEHIAVDPAARRKGVATALIDAARVRARALACTELNLSSWAPNTAAHLAFEASGLRKRRHIFAMVP